jgi:hypothetical protein
MKIPHFEGGKKSLKYKNTKIQKSGDPNGP